ncbi:MAG: carboxypeptidase-like regulatory domain-containing protein [Bacteroidota bacterium]
MFHRIPLLSLCFFAAWGLTAQVMLTGRVTDRDTEEPVAFATVYLDGTSTGDVTADDGTFRIRVTTARRPLVVVISHLNYVNQTLSVDDPAAPLAVALVAQGNELTRIEVEDENQRAKNLREFHRRLIGNDIWGKNARILNEEVLFFERDRVAQDVKVHGARMRPLLRRRNLPGASWSADSSELRYEKVLNLKATTRGALLVDLPDVGYRLRMDLKTFVNDYASRQMAYLGTSFFTPYTEGTKREQKKLTKNRERAYWGSQIHFGRALIADSLAENGFSVVEIVKEARLGGQPETAPINLAKFLVREADGSYRLRGLDGRKFAILYFFGSRFRPAPVNRRRGTAPLQSRLLVAGEAIIYPDGTAGDTNLIFSGNIGGRGLAWWLPSDYQPPRE